MSRGIMGLFGEKDIRKQLIAKDLQPLKFNGIPSAQAVSNISVFRKSEMYLIIAEVEANAGNVVSAKQASIQLTNAIPCFSEKSHLLIKLRMK